MSNVRMSEAAKREANVSGHVLPRLTPLLPDIRMRLHLERIPKRFHRESSVTITNRDALGKLVSAYRQTPSQVETTMANPLSRPMTIGDVAAHMPRFSPANQEAFYTYQRQFARSAELIRTTIPAYRLGEDQFFLLDGNHRATAIYMADVPFEITLVSLDAPPDRRFLVALKYWDGGVKRFWKRLRYR